MQLGVKLEMENLCAYLSRDEFKDRVFKVTIHALQHV
jgi:hypothetical protein